jgi:hypothetical protein
MAIASDALTASIILPMPAHLGAQNAESILGIVIGDALDEARQNFLC